ncbi:MAG: hypothetical protein VYA55_07855 [Pseudomonadota bacterium]|nr:hypothetical protein [Pseudomonadota bacterium]
MNMVKAFLLTLVITLVPTYAFSGSSHPDKYNSKDKHSSYKDKHDSKDRGHDKKECHNGKRCDKDPKGPKGPGGEVTAVPEINAGGTAIALALLGGLVLVARERKHSSQS